MTRQGIIKKAVVVSAVNFLLVLLYVNYKLLHEGKDCGIKKTFLEDIIAYDRNDEPIPRRDCFIEGGIRKEPVFLLIGVPTVYREFQNKKAYYLEETMRSLVKPLGSTERNKVQFLLVLADREEKKRRHMYERISANYSSELKEGLFNLIRIPERYYLKLHDIPSSYNDGPSRMYWRSKQALDYSFIFNYAHNVCEFYMQTEDDAVATPDYFNIITREIELVNEESKKELPQHRVPWQHKKENWLSIQFYSMGYIGVLVPSYNLPVLSLCSKAFYTGVPVDLVLMNIHLFGFSTYRRQEIFKHIGKQSSSSGTI